MNTLYIIGIVFAIMCMIVVFRKKIVNMIDKLTTRNYDEIVEDLEADLENEDYTVYEEQETKHVTEWEIKIKKLREKNKQLRDKIKKLEEENEKLKGWTRQDESSIDSLEP